MSLGSHLSALVREKRTRVIRWTLAQRIAARHPTLMIDPTAIVDYGYHDIDAIEIGEDVSIGAHVEIIVQKRSRHSTVPGRLKLDHGSILTAGANIRAAGGSVVIGRDSGIGQHTVVVAANHLIAPGVTYLRSDWDEQRTGVEVGHNVWVSANCVLLPGTRIGDNAVIAAGSVVRGEVPAGELWGGVPARLLKRL